MTRVSDADVTLEDVFLCVVGGAAKPSKAPLEERRAVVTQLLSPNEGRRAQGGAPHPPRCARGLHGPGAPGRDAHAVRLRHLAGRRSHLDGGRRSGSNAGLAAPRARRSWRAATSHAERSSHLPTTRRQPCASDRSGPCSSCREASRGTSLGAFPPPRSSSWTAATGRPRRSRSGTRPASSRHPPRPVRSRPRSGVGPRVRVRFNPTLRSTYNMVSGVIVLILAMVASLLTAPHHCAGVGAREHGATLRHARRTGGDHRRKAHPLRGPWVRADTSRDHARFVHVRCPDPRVARDPLRAARPLRARHARNGAPHERDREVSAGGRAVCPDGLVHARRDAKRLHVPDPEHAGVAARDLDGGAGPILPHNTPRGAPEGKRSQRPRGRSGRARLLRRSVCWRSRCWRFRRRLA